MGQETPRGGKEDAKEWVKVGDKVVGTMNCAGFYDVGGLSEMQY